MSKRLPLILFGIVLVNYTIFSAGFLVFPPMILNKTGFFSLNASIWERNILLGVLLAVYPLGQIICNSLAGYLLTRSSKKLILIFFLLGMFIAYFLGGFSIVTHNIQLLVLSRLITGLCDGSITISQAFLLEGKVNQYVGTKSISRILLAGNLGYISGPIVMQFIIRFFGFNKNSVSSIFYLGCLFSIFFISILLKTKIPSKMSLDGVSDINATLTNKKIKISKLLMAAFLIFIGIDCLFVFVPVYLVNQWHLEPGKLAYYNMLLAISLSFAQWQLTPLIAKFATPQKVINFSLGLLPLIILIIIFCKNYIYVILMAPLIACVIAMTTTNVNVFLWQISETSRKTINIGMLRSVRAIGDFFACITLSVFSGIEYKIPLFSMILMFCMAYLFAANFSSKYNKDAVIL